MKPTIILVMSIMLLGVIHHAAAQVPFTLSASLTNGTFVRSVTAADVNNDGRPDLITANNSGNSLTVLTNDGHGGFALAATLAMGSGTARTRSPLRICLAVADWI